MDQTVDNNSSTVNAFSWVCFALFGLSMLSMLGAAISGITGAAVWALGMPSFIEVSRDMMIRYSLTIAGMLASVCALCAVALTGLSTALNRVSTRQIAGAAIKRSRTGVHLKR
jgi:hypothetical protein